MDYRQALVEALSRPQSNKRKFVENKEQFNYKDKELSGLNTYTYIFDLDQENDFEKAKQELRKTGTVSEIFINNGYGLEWKKDREVKTEDTEEFLEPRFDSRASFYKKAKVVKKDNGDEELYSYDTHVGGVRGGKPYSKGKFSQTTTRHQKDYFQQRGFDPKEVEIEECKEIKEKEIKTEGEAPLFKTKINKTDIKKVESKKLQETEDMLGRAYDYLDDLGISAADLLVKVSNFFGQDETNEFAHTLLSEMDESKKVEGKEPKRKVISQHNIKKVENKK